MNETQLKMMNGDDKGHVATMMAVEATVHGAIRAYAHIHHASLSELAACVGIRPRPHCELIDDMTGVIMSTLVADVVSQIVIDNVAAGNNDYLAMLLMTVARETVRILDGETSI